MRFPVPERRWGVGLLFTVLILLWVSPSFGARLKDISAFQGIRSNQLMGYGLVVGLNGTGDGTTTQFTIRTIVNMLENMGVHIDSNQIATIKV